MLTLLCETLRSLVYVEDAKKPPKEIKTFKMIFLHQ